MNSDRNHLHPVTTKITHLHLRQEKALTTTSPHLHQEMILTTASHPLPEKKGRRMDNNPRKTKTLVTASNLRPGKAVTLAMANSSSPPEEHLPMKPSLPAVEGLSKMPVNLQ